MHSSRATHNSQTMADLQDSFSIRQAHDAVSLSGSGDEMEALVTRAEEIALLDGLVGDEKGVAPGTQVVTDAKVK